jgi:type II secretory ATPase GspE/PulE/Tfp pilus assembly ATPase PilB-like protein
MSDDLCGKVFPMDRKSLIATFEKDGVSIVDAIDVLLAFAYNERASDIHIDPVESEVKVRFRIDGVLSEVLRFNKNIHQEIVSRIKVLSNLRTDEHQASQDGRFRARVGENTDVDVRVSIAPTYYGENAVLRLLVDRADDFSLDKLGFSSEDQKKITRAMRSPHGMILATGPTGSGKTTTLYTILKELNDEKVSIITIEDPIEYAIEGIEQIQVNPRASLTFANGLRSILRQDPNIIMVGEIRDKETAMIAVNTALTGHLLLSTLHTSDAATTLPRLLDMGIEPYLVASTVNIAIGQRLVRQICEKCKKERKLTDAEAKSLNEALPSAGVSVGDSVFEGGGCKECGKAGYKGRLCVNEVMVVNEAVREAILKKTSSDDLRRIAISEGMKPMVLDGIEKAKVGKTTFEEVIRVIHE